MTPPLVLLGAVLFLFEEVLWAGLGRLMARLGRLPVVARAEAFIRALPPYPAMALFLLPILIILPIKFAAVWLMASGRLLSGLSLLLGAKLTGMAIWARLYALCRPSLVSLAWFARFEAWFLRASAWAHGLLARIPAWQRAKALARLLTSGGSGWLMHRLRAAERLVRSLATR